MGSHYQQDTVFQQAAPAIYENDKISFIKITNKKRTVSSWKKTASPAPGGPHSLHASLTLGRAGGGGTWTARVWDPEVLRVLLKRIQTAH